MSFWVKCVSWIRNLLDMRVTNGEPTSGHKDVYLAGTPKGTFWEKYGQNHRKTTFSPLVDMDFWLAKGLFSFGC